MKKRIQERRARNVELWRRDQANRCGFCRRELKPGYVTVIDAGGTEQKLCDDACLADQRNAQEAQR